MIELEMPKGKQTKEVVLQMPLNFDGDPETTPEVCCYPCDGNCLEVFTNLPVEAVCNRPADLDLVFRKHFGDVQ